MSRDKRNKRKARLRRDRLRGESIESRVLLSGTWVDPSTGNAIPDATSGDDVYQGTSGNDLPNSGGSGNDVLFGGAGNDTLGGGTDLDVLMGGAGNDDLNGGTQADVLDGGAGDDLVIGGSGADTLIGGGGSDDLRGNAGTDTFRFTGAQHGDVYNVQGGDGTDTIDLTEFGSGTVSDDGSTIQVDLGDSNSFTINYTNIEVVVTADTAGNHGPDADAGVDQSVRENTTVTLDASRSGDFDGDALTYNWTQIGGPSVTLSNSAAEQPTFTSPSVSSETTLTFSVVVSDGTTSHVDTVTVRVLSIVQGEESATGTSGGDYVRLDPDEDESGTLRGEGGDDVLLSTSGNDNIQGGTGTDIVDYSGANTGVTVDVTVTTAQSTGGGGTDTLSGIEGVRGSNSNDTFEFSNPQDGAVYYVDGNGGISNVIDLSGYSSDAVTFGDGRVTVDMGGGQSFTVEHTNVDRITFSDVWALVLSTDIGTGSLSGTAIYIDGDEAFKMSMSTGSVNYAYDIESDTLTVTGTTGAGSSSSLAITDLNGTDLRVDQITLDQNFGDLTTNVGVGAISLGGLVYDIDGTFTIGGDLGSLTAYEINGTVDVRGDVGTVHIYHDIQASGSLLVSGDVTSITIDDDINGTVTIDGNVTTFDLTGSNSANSDIHAGAVITIGGDVQTFHVQDDLLGSVSISGDVASFTVDDDVDAVLLSIGGDAATFAAGNVHSDVTIGGDADTVTIGQVHSTSTFRIEQVVGTLVFTEQNVDHGGTYATPTLYVFGDNSAPTFSSGGDGIVETQVTSSWDGATAITTQPDGKIIAVGGANNGSDVDVTLVRYNADGSLDTGFGANGIVTTQIGSEYEAGYDVVVQPDGKILVGGYVDVGSHKNFAVLRYTAAGQLDTSFDGDGIVDIDFGGQDDTGRAIKLQSDGKILVAGEARVGGVYYFGLVRLDADGSLDTSFDGDGKVTTSIGSGDDKALDMAVQSDGRIVLVGTSHNGSNTDFAVVRYDSDGSLDSGFGGGSGSVTFSPSNGDTDTATSVALQSDGKIVVGGNARISGNQDFAVARLNLDGTLDTSFNGTGIASTGVSASFDSGYDMAIQPDGKIVLTGMGLVGNNNFAIVRFAVVRRAKRDRGAKSRKPRTAASWRRTRGGRAR